MLTINNMSTNFVKNLFTQKQNGQKGFLLKTSTTNEKDAFEKSTDALHFGERRSKSRSITELFYLPPSEWTEQEKYEYPEEYRRTEEYFENRNNGDFLDEKQYSDVDDFQRIFESPVSVQKNNITELDNSDIEQKKFLIQMSEDQEKQANADFLRIFGDSTLTKNNPLPQKTANPSFNKETTYSSYNQTQQRDRMRDRESTYYQNTQAYHSQNPNNQRVDYFGKIAYDENGSFNAGKFAIGLYEFRKRTAPDKEHSCYERNNERRSYFPRIVEIISREIQRSHQTDFSEVLDQFTMLYKYPASYPGRNNKNLGKFIRQLETIKRHFVVEDDVEKVIALKLDKIITNLKEKNELF